MIKTITTIVFLLLSVTSFAQTQTKILTVDIRGVGCHGGSGLCSIMSENNKENSNSIVITKQSFNTIFLIIDVKKLSIEEQNNCFGKEYAKISSSDILQFTQDGDFVFNEKILISLGIESKYNTIKKGSYPYTINKDIIHVKMALMEN